LRGFRHHAKVGRHSSACMRLNGAPVKVGGGSTRTTGMSRATADQPS